LCRTLATRAFAGNPYAPFRGSITEDPLADVPAVMVSAELGILFWGKEMVPTD
jgi:hypothetical protein